MAKIRDITVGKIVGVSLEGMTAKEFWTDTSKFAVNVDGAYLSLEEYERAGYGIPLTIEPPTIDGEPYCDCGIQEIHSAEELEALVNVECPHGFIWVEVL